MKLGTHMPGGERRKPINIEDRNTKVKVTTSKKRTKIRFHPVTIRHVCTKFHLDPTFRSLDIMRKQKKYQIFVLFLEVVTLTFVLQTSISTGFLLSPSGGAIISAQYIKNEMSDLYETWYTHARW
jgi:hypothetical protein